jgi:hypothetical protein
MTPLLEAQGTPVIDGQRYLAELRRRRPSVFSSRRLPLERRRSCMMTNRLLAGVGAAIGKP